jgi:hypothetical protein
MQSSIRTIIFIWLAWAVVLNGFQSVVEARLVLRKPDFALSWTPSETTPNSRNDKIYLNDLFMNAQVSWDSEFYLSIATVGYDDPAVRSTPPDRGQPLSLNYAFFPFYPTVMRAVSLPLRVLNLTPIATSTLAGVLVSVSSTLFAMVALYDLTREELGEDGGLRAAFYLLIFPTGFFLAQVYTEGLFVALAFGSLALMRRKHVLIASILAVLAVWTRAVGIALVIPLLLAWTKEIPWKQLSLKAIPWRLMVRGLLVLLPIGAYLLWQQSSLGTSFKDVEDTFFSRGLLQIESSLKHWSETWQSLFGDNTQATVYYLLEFATVALALICSVLTLRHYPAVALFSLIAVIVSFTSGVPQSMARYVLAAPAMFIQLSRWGRHPAFDRSWTLASVLLMGMLVTLFTYDMWVA